MIQNAPGGIVHTESVVYSGDPTVHHTSTTNVPVVATEARKVQLTSDDGSYSAIGEIVSSQTITSKTRTVETTTVSDLNYSRLPVKEKPCWGAVVTVAKL